MPEMLATIHRNRVPGVFEVQLGDFTKRVFILGGDIIFASSTNRGESLGDSLLASGQITVAQYRESALKLLGNPGKRHGQVLVEMGLLTRGGDARSRAPAGAAHRLEPVRPRRGAGDFTLGEDRADEVYKLADPDAARRAPRLQDRRRRKTADDAGWAERRRCSRGRRLPEHLKDFQLEAGEEELLDLADGRRTLFELCDQGPFSAGLNARVLYAFSCLGLIKKEKDAPAGIRVQVPSTDPALM